MAMVGEKIMTLLPNAGDVGEAPPSIAASVAGNGVPVPVPVPPPVDPLAATPDPAPAPLDTLPDALPVETVPADALPELVLAPEPPEDTTAPPEAPDPAKVPVEAPVPTPVLPAPPDPAWPGPFPVEPQPGTVATRVPPRMSAQAGESRGKRDEMTFIKNDLSGWFDARALGTIVCGCGLSPRCLRDRHEHGEGPSREHPASRLRGSETRCRRDRT
jgi:hypothetical protein